ncbi:MAG: hypothetical protein WAK48_24740 [Candidatus Acidiferrum sp.]
MIPPKAGIFRGEDGAFALFDEPASKHGDFLAKIGGVSEAREFVRLKDGAGNGEKKFPRACGRN